jgi:molecular chaperone DnaK
LIHATEKSLRELGDKVTGEERAKIESALADAKEAIKSDNKTTIETKLRALGEASAGMAQRLYASQQQGGGGGPSGEQPAGGSENVVDAEFEEVKDDQHKRS